MTTTETPAMTFDDGENPLVSLGFTDLEARIYVFLLERSPITGYGVAKALCKPAANTYKALDALERKGAVIVEEGARRLCRAVAPADLLAQIDRRYQRLRSRADETLASLHRDNRDDRVYRLRSTERVVEKARSMLDGAREIVLIDAFPDTMGLLEDRITDAVARGVLVGIKAYAPTNIDGAVVVMGIRAGAVRRRWPGAWLNVVADGAEYLMAHLTEECDAVTQAIWTECPYLAWVHQSAFSSELIHTVLTNMIDAGASRSELQEANRNLFRLKALRAPGYRAILREMEKVPPA